MELAVSTQSTTTAALERIVAHVTKDNQPATTHKRQRGKKTHTETKMPFTVNTHNENKLPCQRSLADCARCHSFFGRNVSSPVDKRWDRSLFILQY